MNRIRLAMAVGFVVALSNAHAQDKTVLRPGDPAPALQVNQWLSGEPVTTFADDQIYVIEFWATWCGPCIELIPQLSALAQKHDQVKVIGLSIDQDVNSARQFVDSWGDKISYRTGHVGATGPMIDGWLKAAAQDGIPTTFIIHRQTLLWIGPTNDLDAKLTAIKNGRYDLLQAQKAFSDFLESQRVAQEINTTFQTAAKLREQGDATAARTTLSELQAKHPQVADQVNLVTFQWLAEDNPQQWLERVSTAVASTDKQSLQPVLSVALRLARQSPTADTARRGIGLVLKSSTPPNWEVLMYAKAIYTQLGDDRELLQVITCMLEIYETSPARENLGLKQTLQETKQQLSARQKDSDKHQR